MTSIASIILNKYNGVPDEVPAEAPKSTQPRVHADDVVMTESDVAWKNDMLQKLHHGIWVVEFEKADGTMAMLDCTLDPQFMPPARDPAMLTEPKRAEVKHLIHAYAIDRQGWRSFRVPNVKRFTEKVQVA